MSIICKCSIIHFTWQDEGMVSNSLKHTTQLANKIAFHISQISISYQCREFVFICVIRLSQHCKKISYIAAEAILLIGLNLRWKSHNIIDSQRASYLGNSTSCIPLHFNQGNNLLLLLSFCTDFVMNMNHWLLK